MDLHALAIDRGPRFTPIDLGLGSRLVMLGHERLADVTQLTSTRMHVAADLALRDLRARIEPNVFCVLFGPSGCGKSTLLNLIAGIDRSFAGNIRFDGNCVSHIGYVFQASRLLPWRTVRENLELVLRPGADPAIVEALLAEVGLAEAAGFYPSRLSGGMARRAALARAFAIDPDLLLLDEPFVSLDAAAAMRLRPKQYLRAEQDQPAFADFRFRNGHPAVEMLLSPGPTAAERRLTVEPRHTP